MKEKKKGFVSYQEEIMNLASKEEEIVKSYEDEKTEIKKPKTKKTKKVKEVKVKETKIKEPKVTKKKAKKEKTYDYEAYEEAVILHKRKRAKRIINIVFGIIVLILTMVAVDIIAVSRFDVGPFFSIPLHTYDDGGTKEYYGLGYKVIKYHQIQGRRDRELGSWSLEYNAEPITVEDVDLAIELGDDSSIGYTKYHNKFVRIISTLTEVDEKNHKITMEYKDEDNKYALTMKCDVVKEQKSIKRFEPGKEITIIGTVKDFQPASKFNSNTMYIKNCFAEQ